MLCTLFFNLLSIIKNIYIKIYIYIKYRIKKFLQNIIRSLNFKLRNVPYETRREITVTRKIIKERKIFFQVRKKEKFSSRKNESIKMYLTSG